VFGREESYCQKIDTDIRTWNASEMEAGEESSAYRVSVTTIKATEEMKARAKEKQESPGRAVLDEILEQTSAPEKPEDRKNTENEEARPAPFSSVPRPSGEPASADGTGDAHEPGKYDLPETSGAMPPRDQENGAQPPEEETLPPDESEQDNMTHPSGDERLLPDGDPPDTDQTPAEPGQTPPTDGRISSEKSPMENNPIPPAGGTPSPPKSGSDADIP
ncbi:MAG: hypothetical protein K5853_05620, partial [Lachnospiraceae bacterium]|nr:hypothetical protein [Lachnospiraceae bacterium]